MYLTGPDRVELDIVLFQCFPNPKKYLRLTVAVRYYLNIRFMVNM